MLGTHESTEQQASQSESALQSDVQVAGGSKPSPSLHMKKLTDSSAECPISCVFRHYRSCAASNRALRLFTSQPHPYPRLPAAISRSLPRITDDLSVFGDTATIHRYRINLVSRVQDEDYTLSSVQRSVACICHGSK
jgi:hypothetical protein